MHLNCNPSLLKIVFQLTLPVNFKMSLDLQEARFQRRLNEVIEGLDGVRTVTDDIIVFGVGDTEDVALRDHDTKFLNLLERCRQKHITFNKDKLQFKLHEQSYVGHVISAEGLKPDLAKVEAVLGMPSPADKQGVRRIMGQVNYCRDLRQACQSLRNISGTNVESVWEESVHGKFFKGVKAVVPAPVTKFFDPSDCAVCMSYQPNQQKEPMISHEIPTRPCEKAGCDLFDFKDNNYLVCVDYQSDYFEIDKICDRKGKEVISKLKSQLARHGIPRPGLQ